MRDLSDNFVTVIEIAGFVARFKRIIGFNHDSDSAGDFQSTAKEPMFFAP
ncbi:MAG: hypothetical protein Q8R82_21275 [Hyphomonadaceae bacterium]|nr:hypothetical protein [Hyphomonadaceae bacterium]